MFDAKVKIGMIEYRIRLLTARGEVMNEKLIKALVREKRKLENDCGIGG